MNKPLIIIDKILFTLSSWMPGLGMKKSILASRYLRLFMHESAVTIRALFRPGLLQELDYTWH